MKPDGVMQWDPALMAQALHLRGVDSWFRDGRHSSALLESRLTAVQPFAHARSSNAAYDLLDPTGGQWEVRAITAKGVHFKPSSMLGKGREFNILDWLAKLKAIRGFVLTDIEAFPDVPYWMIPTHVVESWWGAGKLGKGLHASRKRALELIHLACFARISL